MKNDRGFISNDAGIPIRPEALTDKLNQASWHGVKAKPHLDRQGALTYQFKV